MRYPKKIWLKIEMNRGIEWQLKKKNVFIFFRIKTPNSWVLFGHRSVGARGRVALPPK